MNPNTPSPPPLPTGPPPVPKDGAAAERAASVRKRTVLSIVIAVAVIVVGFGALVIGIGALYFVTADELAMTPELESAVVTIHDMEKWFEIEVRPELEEWETEYYFDRSANVMYFYDDSDAGIYLNCNLTYEPKSSDARMMYQLEWGGLKLGNRLGPGEDIELEDASELFAWGDQSKFAFQNLEGERYGFAFLGRKRGKIFFIDSWGLVLEDPDEIADFLQPHLEAFETLRFEKQSDVNP
ncbi:MAG: hypothetical protein AAGA96_07965 [Verrucomicrobiota bacterium]